MASFFGMTFAPPGCADRIASHLDVANAARPASQLTVRLIAIPSPCNISVTLDGEAQNARY
jgi:hypothetical protein